MYFEIILLSDNNNSVILSRIISTETHAFAKILLLLTCWDALLTRVLRKVVNILLILNIKKVTLLIE